MWKRLQIRYVPNRNPVSLFLRRINFYLHNKLPIAQSVEKKGEKSPRKAKDPDAPKHPRAGFVVFNSNVEIRKALKEQFPEASPQDLMRLLGAQWAAMKPDEKDKYEEVAKQERTIYKAEKEAYGKKKASEQGSSLVS